MSQTLSRRMTDDELLEWDLLQPDGRHELVDGAPVAMTGAHQRHDEVLYNVLMLIGRQLRGKPCRPFTAGGAVRIPAGGIRRPDVGVRCPAFDEAATCAANPVLLVEILSPSTRGVYLLLKADEYRSIPSVRHLLTIEPDLPEVIIWSGLTGSNLLLRGLDAMVEVSDPELRFSLGDIYEGLTFPPHLVS